MGGDVRRFGERVKPPHERRVYVMRLHVNDYGAVTVESYEYPEEDRTDLLPGHTTLYSRTRHQGDIDVRALLFDQYVNLATWLHRQGLWEQLAIDH